MDEIKMGSLFDGSAGFPLAAVMYGIQAVWASEIEPYPIRVTTKRLPFMKHYGDISSMNGADIEPVDIITGGSPCQDMSVAGKRAGLDGERSGLFREQIRIIKEMREATNGKYPRYMVWENVPGALSSNKGQDFRCVLEETARIKEPGFDVPMPAKNKWSTAGLIMGDDFSIGWRILDAQYWGVPQRRRRIFLVADFSGTSAGEILFKREGLSWHFAQSREAWQTASGSLTTSTNETGRDAIGFDRYNQTDSGNKASTLKCPNGGDNLPVVFESTPIQVPMTMQIRCGCEGGGKGALIQTNQSATLSTHNVQTLFQPIPIQDQAISNGSENGNGIAEPDDPMYTLMAETHHGVAYSIDDTKMANTYVWEEQGNTLAARDYKGPQAVCYSLQGNMIGRSDENGPQGSGINEEVNFTLNATDRHSVCYQDVIGSLNASDYKWPQNQRLGENKFIVEEISSYQEVTGPLMANSHPGSYTGQDAQNDMLVANNYIVRRLTPLECARLQGFPDWWTADLGTKEEDITEEMMNFWRNVFETHRKIVTGASKPKTDKQIKKWLMDPDSDSAEYKMWGNGVALPCVLYVMEGIADVLRKA